MPKYHNINEYIETFNSDAVNYYNNIKQVIINSDEHVKERLFAGQIAFYKEKTLKKTFHSSPVIVLAFFKDHVNVFASGNSIYKDSLPMYTFTEKDTMQIYYDTPLEEDILKKLFSESLK